MRALCARLDTAQKRSAFAERIDARALENGDMEKDILVFIFRDDESKPLRCIEPFEGGPHRPGHWLRLAENALAIHWLYPDGL